jgi:hypothetical protein
MPLSNLIRDTTLAPSATGFFRSLWSPALPAASKRGEKSKLSAAPDRILNPRSLPLAERIREGEKIFDGDKSGAGLGRAPVVDHRDLLHARNGAMRRAGFLGMVLVGKVVRRVFLQRNSRKAALL